MKRFLARYNKKKGGPICTVIESQMRVLESLPKRMDSRVLRFNSIQITEWLDALLRREDFETHRARSREFGVDRTRIWQFLNLLRLQSGYLSELKRTPDLAVGTVGENYGKGEFGATASSG